MLDRVPRLTDRQFDELMASILKHHLDKFKKCVDIYNNAMLEVSIMESRLVKAGIM